MEEELSQRKNDADMARIAAEEEKVEKVELKKKLSHVKHKLMQLSEDYVIFRKGQLDLKTSYEKVKLTLEHTLRELLELRRTSSDQMACGCCAISYFGQCLWLLAAMRPFLIEGGHIAQTKQLKAVISKLQCGLDEADRVADLLRDKLHHQKAQLVDSTAKVKELEHNRTEGWNEKMIVGRNLDRFETKLEGLTERMIKREEVLVGALAEAALAETKAAMAVEKQQEAQIALQEKEEELIKLRGISDENIKIRLQMNSADHKTSELAAKNHEILHKLSEAEHKLRCREKETIALQSELQLLEADARKLQLLLDQSKEITQKSSEELSNMTVKENIATEKNDTMEAESLRVKGEIDHLNKSLHQSNLQLVIIQEKFDSQATTLRSVREENRNLQERLLEREKSFAGKFWALEASIAVLREQKCTVETQLIEQCEKIKSERVVFADASAIFKKQVAGRETASRLLETQEQRAADAEGNAADSKRRLVEMQSRAEAAEAAKLELEGCVEAQSARLKNETAAALELMEEMVMLKKKVVVLEQSSTIELTLARNLKGKEQASPESRLMVDSGFGISSSPQAVMMSPFRPLSYSSPVNAEAQASPVGPTPAISPRETRFRTQLGLNPSPSPLTVAPKFSTLSGMDTDDDDSELSDPPTSSPVMLEKRKRVVSPMNNKGSQRHLKALPKLALPILRRGSRDRHPARMKEPVVLSARGNQDHKPSWRG
ncbi:hypothetical protein BD779DRAFT_1557102 [Infundibulicybe gibba]|nr:hypothetical protein BD779DRAFT_1557102 [Infundibulicybe gibba]